VPGGGQVASSQVSSGPVSSGQVASSQVASSQVASGPVASAAQPQTTTPLATGTKPARQIGLLGKPMPNISPSSSSGYPFADMGAFAPCIPGDVQARYVYGVTPAAAQYQIQPWAWAVCHSGEWLYRGNNYVWVAGRRHHHPPCHWVKSGDRIVLIPTHPHDVKGHLPVNRTNPVFEVNPKGAHPIERVELERHASMSLMKEPPREFRAEFVRPLTPVAEPHMVAYRMQDVITAKGEPVRPGTPITFNSRSQSFMMTQQEMHGGRSVPVSVPINNHTGNLQSHNGFSGGGGSSGFHAGGGSAAHGGWSGGSSAGSGGGGSHTASSISTSGTVSSGAGASASSASSGASHH
jgi:hypothetical protein